MAPIKVQKTNVVSNRTAKPVRRAPLTRGQRQSSLDEDGEKGDILPQVGKRKADASPLRNDKIKRSALGNVTNAMLNALDDSKKLALRPQKSSDSLQLGSKKIPLLSAYTKSKSNENVLQSTFLAPHAVAQRPTKVVTRSSSRSTITSSVQQTIKSIANSLTEKAQKENIVTTATKGKKKTDATSTSNNNNSNANATLNRNASDPNIINGEKDKPVAPAKPNGRRISNEFDLFDSEESHYMSALEDLLVFSHFFFNSL